MKSSRDNLTNEKLKQPFLSQFDLVNYAIELAAESIQAGRIPRFNNIALQTLDDISMGLDRTPDRPNSIRK